MRPHCRWSREHFNATGPKRELSFKATAEILASRNTFQELPYKLFDTALVMLCADHADRWVVPVERSLRIWTVLSEPLLSPSGLTIVVEDKNCLLNLPALALNIR